MESFFGIGLPELVLILVIAGIVMGPERIGVAARWLGKTTAQLQGISRSFVKQLNAELDGIQDADEIRGAVQDMRDLRDQLDQLKKELISVSNGATREGKQAVAEIQHELERTIAPPGKSETSAGTSNSAMVETIDNPAAEPLSSDDLPKRLEIPDDPEA
ncbi:MAG: twin-arginine translocase TatA/TatE family subunit [Candidatus Promineifilaceae bacterium]